MSEQIDQEYYEVVRKGGIAERLLVAARDRMFRDFMHMVKPTAGSTVLDVGVSDVQVRGANWLESVYPYPSQITACGLGEGVDFREAFPSIAYSKIAPNEPLPFPDDAFEVSTANAVLEHVGSIDNQRRFVDEMVRVARKAFITVPHRFFPVEHHTKTPLLHFTDTTFRAACRVTGKTRWLEQKNLILMSKSHLQSLAPTGSIVRHTGIPLGPFSSNLLLFFEKP